jgi:tetratricopeptide (TPR) repeat protein
MQFKIRWRFLLKLGVALLVSAVAVHLVHRWQVRSQAGAFLRQADLAREAAEREHQAGDREKANSERERELAYLQRYILARPDDLDVRERHARLLCDMASGDRQSQNAYFVLDEVLRRDPARDDLRLFAIKFAMRPGGANLFKEARENLELLRKKRPEDGELEGLYAHCLAVFREFAEAEKCYRASIKSRPDLIESHVGLAVVLQQLGKRQEADGTIAAMVAADATKNDYRTHLNAAEYYRTYGKFDPTKRTDLPQNELLKEIRERIAEARRLKPDSPETLLAEVDVLRAEGRLLAKNPGTREQARELTETARRLIEEGILRHKAEHGFYLAKASLQAEAGQVRDALRSVRAGLEQIPDRMELMIGLLDYQFLAGDAPGAAETLDKLRARGLRKEMADFGSARVMMLREEWGDAAATLRRVIPALRAEQPDLARRAELLRARCYEQLGDHARRLEAYQSALPGQPSDPLWAQAMLGVAESETALGRLDGALGAYRKLAESDGRAWIPIAKLELHRAVRQAGGKRDWTAFEDALRRAELVGAKVDSAEAGILRVAYEHFRGNPDAARKRLQELRDERPEDSSVRIEFATQALREGKHAEALATLDAAEQEFGESPELLLMRARVWSDLKDPELAAKLTALAGRAEKFGPQEKRRLLRDLAEVASASGADKAAGKLWDDLAAAKPSDLGVHMIRFDRASRSGDLQGMKAVLDEINRIDGADGPNARLARAVLLIRESQAADDRGRREEALRVLEGLERDQGPSTPARVLLAQALAHDLNGNFPAAKAKYSQAAERGGISPQAALRLVELLAASGGREELREAAALIQKHGNAAELGPDFGRLATSVFLRNDEFEGAVAFAERAAAAPKADFRDQLRLAITYWAAREQGKAPADPKRDPLAAFRKATGMAPAEADAWLGLMRYLVGTGAKAEAAKAFDAARDKVKPEDRGLFLGLGHALLGDSAKAVEAFQQARAERPSDVRVLSAEAEFLLQLGRLEDARAGFQRVIGLPTATAEERANARLRLAVATAADPSFAVSQEATKLLDAIPAGDTPAQRRSRALVLALQKDRKSKLEAIRILEENAKGRSADEHFMLAQLHNMVGNQTRVRVVMEDLLRSEKHHVPLYLRFYAAWLLRSARFRPGLDRSAALADAERWIKVLARVDPDSLPTAELKARLAGARDDPRGAWEALEPKTRGADAPVGVVARICEDLGLHERAEPLLRRFVEANRQKEPAVVMALAAYHGRRGQTAEGLKICEEARGKVPWPLLGQVAVGILYHARGPVPAESARVAEWLDDAARKAQGTERAALLQELAAVRNLQGDYAAAAALYRQVIEANPKDALARNNLAYLLSAGENNHQAGLALIDQAKGIIGPNNHTLLDTEALIRLNMGQAEEARRLLEVVVAEGPSASGYFHLTLAERALKNESAAKRAWQRAGDLKLKRAELHPLERKGYDELVSEYGPHKDGAPG